MNPDYTELRKAAEVARPDYTDYRMIQVDPSAILALLDERENLLKIAEAAQASCKVNFSGGFVDIRDALKEWKE